MPDDNIRLKFAQIYTVNGTQEQMNARQNYINNLNLNIFRMIEQISLKLIYILKTLKATIIKLKIIKIIVQLKL